MEHYATTTGIMLRGLRLPYQAPSPTVRNQASGARSQQPVGPATKFAPTDQRSRQTQRLDNRKDGSQHTPKWRANPNRVQQSRSGFAPRSHQTQADDDYVLQINDGDDTPESDADDHADTVSSHQTEIDNAACSDADADIVAFDHENDYVNYWPGSTSHQVHIIDQETTSDLTEWWCPSEFEWHTEPLKPQLARAMGITEFHTLEVMSPLANQVGPVSEECHTLVKELGAVGQKALSKARIVPTKTHPKWTVPIRLAANGPEISTIAEVDTRSSTMLISHSIVERLGGKVELLTGSIHLAGETTLPCWGRCTVMLSTADHTYVLHTEAFLQEINPPVLLGIDVIEQYGLGELLAGVKHRADHPVAENTGDDVPERDVGDDSEHREHILQQLKAVLDANTAIDLNKLCPLPGAVLISITHLVRALRRYNLIINVPKSIFAATQNVEVLGMHWSANGNWKVPDHRIEMLQSLEMP
ncbi:hypothetical protein COEREDRAFT_11292 [Coemansia reversa NRRL 1564]|uniref:Uncharacterized protein n=1 Tax=Coemansia reversa (strain ATCC 12441 / NRRL 1564) TaxID=763665 RepID=A0A2G5B478_COERN|nr:hypothetical protein COEREDRAFT_11292 [Coemansia reversa NRRL 1564]|eukprot:PIA13537.1 hypothetical protein COEREDRAFT_11292 [Coemansia reversa NRRL 1564]